MAVRPSQIRKQRQKGSLLFPHKSRRRIALVCTQPLPSILIYEGSTTCISPAQGESKSGHGNVSVYTKIAEKRLRWPDAEGVLLLVCSLVGPLLLRTSTGTSTEYTDLFSAAVAALLAESTLNLKLDQNLKTLRHAISRASASFLVTLFGIHPIPSARRKQPVLSPLKHAIASAYNKAGGLFSGPARGRERQ